MSEKIYKTIEEVFDKLKPSYGHSFKEFDVNHRLDDPKNKGRLGQIVEEGILGYPINSNPEADLKELGIEIKTTGVIQKKDGDIRAKERLAIDSLNYSSIIKFDFKNSPMWLKADEMLFVFYGYEKGKPYGDMKIITAALNKFSPEDIAIINKDYDEIIGKIKAGHAQDISEGDTVYLGACTAGTGKPEPQPFSSIKAKQRKFCLKQSFFSHLIQSYVSAATYEHALSFAELKSSTFEEAIITKLRPFFGMDEKEIRNKFSIKNNPKEKDRYERYIAAMLGINGKVNKTDEFVKSQTELKTIRVQANGRIKESMSFPFFEFTDIVKQDWEDSDSRELFASQRFLFAIFEEQNGTMVFKNVKFWNMKETELDEKIKPVFEELKKTLKTGNIVSKITITKSGKTIRHNNFPGMKDNEVAHVRPHGRDANDTLPLPVKDKLTGATSFTKQCFWLNNSYIKKILSN
jgi:DNA mismatch repair protein MutH